MKRYAWLTDIHLEFLVDKETATFVKDLAAQELEGLFITGDISTATQIEAHLQLFENLYQSPVYFVLGNHDYYGGSLEIVRKVVEEICSKSKWLHWLPASGVVRLNKDTCLIGHDGWADGRFGDYTPQGGTEKSATSKVLLNDYSKSHNFVRAGDVLTKSMATCLDKQMTVLCGHTHSSGMCRILPNLEVKTGGAKYGSPIIQEVLSVD